MTETGEQNRGQGVVPMGINNFVTKAMKKEYSLGRHFIRTMKDSCLHDDFEEYIARHDICSGRLVNKLLENHFEAARYSDPEYPL